jgi:hypothetical protein
MMMYSNSLALAGRRVAYSLIRSRFRRTIGDIRHPRTDTTAFLPRFSATAELLVIDLVAHHVLDTYLWNRANFLLAR